MSHYYDRYCKVHGDWSMDVDNPISYCPKCGDPNEKEIADLEADNARLREAAAEKVVTDLMRWTDAVAPLLPNPENYLPWRALGELKAALRGTEPQAAGEEKS